MKTCFSDPARSALSIPVLGEQFLHIRSSSPATSAREAAECIANTGS
ncbi:MAG: hypothetical protein ING75_10260 [Rhodocyclaceae bacterium]|nr:hypothetical protein [Rhodocyclaceae bacterium]